MQHSRVIIAKINHVCNRDTLTCERYIATISFRHDCYIICHVSLSLVSVCLLYIESELNTSNDSMHNDQIRYARNNDLKMHMIINMPAPDNAIHKSIIKHVTETDIAAILVLIRRDPRIQIVHRPVVDNMIINHLFVLSLSVYNRTILVFSSKHKTLLSEVYIHSSRYIPQSILSAISSYSSGEVGISQSSGCG